MFKKIILVMICVLCSSYVCAMGKVQHEYTLEDIRNSLPINLPIDSKREAIEFAKTKMPFEDAEDIFHKVEKENEYIKGWIVSARLQDPKDDIKLYKKQFKNGIYDKASYEENVRQAEKRGKYWKVVFFSEGQLPSYRWTISFLSDGELISNKHGWSK